MKCETEDERDIYTRTADGIVYRFEDRLDGLGMMIVGEHKWNKERRLAMIATVAAELRRQFPGATP